MMDAGTIDAATKLVGAVTTLIGTVGGFIFGRKAGKKERDWNIKNPPDAFYYAGGSFRLEEHGWTEYDAHDNLKFRFKQLRFEDGFLILYDQSRSLSVRLPLKGGQAQMTGIEENVWRNLYRVEPERP